jgi:hypothetical protein
MKLDSKLYLTSLLCTSVAIGCSPAASSDKQDSLISDKDSVQILTNKQVAEAERLPDFSYAGYNHGIGPIPSGTGEIIDVTQFGVIADDDIDDSHALLAALEAAHETTGSVVVKLPKGRIIISEILKITRGDITLRGEGSGTEGTNLHFPRPLQMIDKTDSLNEIREYLLKYDKRQKEKDRNIDELFSEYSWSGGFIWIQKEGTRAAAYLESKDPKITVLAQAIAGQAGTRKLDVSDTSRLKVGDVVELQWLNREGENGPLLREVYGDTELKIGSHHWTFPDRPLIRQKTKILDIDGATVEISDPLLHQISQDIPAQFAEWDHLKNVGIEKLQISFPQSPYFGHHLERGYNGIYFTSVFDGWVNDVTFLNADTGILSYNSANVTFSDITTNGDREAHYSVHAGNVHNVLIENLTVNNAPVHSLSLNTQSTKCVFKNAIVNNGAVLDQHAGANHQNLFDNITLNVDAQRDESGAFYPVWDGSGAGYWQPGHGRFNTTWNLKVNVRSGADADEAVTLRGLAEGPNARIVGISGNRDFNIDYRPVPYSERINVSMEDVPSLYDYQLRQRSTP